MKSYLTLSWAGLLLLITFTHASVNLAIGIEEKNVEEVALAEIFKMIDEGRFGEKVQIYAKVLDVKLRFVLESPDIDIIPTRDVRIGLGFEVGEELWKEDLECLFKKNRGKVFLIQGRLEDHNSIGMGYQFTATYLVVAESRKYSFEK